MMSTEQKLPDGKKIIYTKGALDSILRHTTQISLGGAVRPITPQDVDDINAAASAMAKEAFRVLAFAYRMNDTEDRPTEENLIYVGMVGMIDPERPEAKPAVEKLKGAGIETIMITGDHKDTAFAIAHNLGIAENPDQCVSGDQLNEMSPEKLQETVKTARVFARVSPENKVQIVKALKANGNIVSMTGDGVNDAPSLRAADIGIAMGITGTDVAKSAADMVLTDDNFASIEKAVEEGRGIFANVKKSILYLLSSNFGEVLVMFITLMLGWPLPLATLQILWINLLTDSLPAIALGMDDKEKDIMKQKPKNPKDGFFAHGAFAFTLGYGVLIFLITMTAFLLPVFEHMGAIPDWNWSWDGLVRCMNSQDASGQYIGVMYNGTSYVTKSFESEAALDAVQFSEGYLNVHEQAQTFAFTVLAMSQIFHMVGMTDIKRSFLHVFRSRNWMLLVAFVAGFGLQILVTEVDPLALVFGTTKLQWFEWLELAGFAMIPLLAHEILAPIFRKKQVQII
jgi:Ca2+-transporting ATPase